MVKAKKKAISLEAYEHFLDDPSQDALNMNQLNEVILMHGFKKIYQRPKHVLYDALITVDLIKLQRSTLKDELSPYGSSVSLDQVKLDLEALDWPECHIHSIESVGQTEPESNTNSSGNLFSKDDDDLELPVSCSKISGRKRGSKRMKRSTEEDGGAACSNNIAVAADVGSVNSF
ncbi:hypothetical protein JCGZ_19049 [Jatropha curcas]|uniref:DUF7787 domain-containing protein n=1 Tax=Jatropha curcas TaxID=180498 RepID=A0A067K817_JATCU|nr:uncharacterized protein LOC105643687 [Jatropha curcas]KDP27969.1 hypothetical protein JCGZ_19049 [Jatropha curcas]